MADIGDVVRLSATVRDADGVLADATAMSLTVTLPDGTAQSLGTVAPSSTGVYVYDYATTAEGRHTVRWVATGTNAGTFADVFHVDAADPGYLVGLSEVKQHLNLDDTDLTEHGEELRGFLASATATIESLIGPVIPRTVVETHRWAKPGLPLLLRTRPVLAVTSIADVDGNVYAASDYTVDGSAVYFDGGYTSGTPWVYWGWRSVWSGDVTVTYRAGRSVVPAAVREAAVELVRDRWSATQRGGQGAPLAAPGYAVDESAFTAGRPAVPPYVLGLLEPYLLGPVIA